MHPMNVTIRIMIAAALAIALNGPAGAHASPAPANSSGQFANINGLKMYYEIHGGGQPLVMLHGAFSTVGAWGSVLTDLAQSRQVIAIELEGHGHTNDLDRPLSYRQMADDVAALLGHLNIERADVFGYSMGGTVGIMLAIHHPQRVRKLAFFGSIADRARLVFEDFAKFQTLPDNFSPPVLREPYDKAAPDPSRWPVLVKRIKALVSDFEGIAPNDLRRIQAPTLIMSGDKDIIRPEHPVELFRAIPNSQLAIFPNTDHFLVSSDPGKLVATIIPFLDDPVAPPTNATPAAEEHSSDRPRQAPGQVKSPAKSVEQVKSKDGTSIAFERSGSGPALILVSGALSDRKSNTRLASLLAPHFTVINYDRRGRGESGDTHPYAVQHEIDDIEAIIDHVGGSPFIFGSSSGAALALEATAKLGRKITRAALFEPPFIVDDSRPPMKENLEKRATELVAAGQRGDAVEYFMTAAVGVPAEHVAQLRQSPMWPAMEKLAHTLAYDGAVMGDTLYGKPLPASRWRSATLPIVVIDGGDSDDWLQNAARALTNVLPNATHRTIEGHTHAATFMAPQVFVPLLVEFFSDSSDNR